MQMHSEKKKQYSESRKHIVGSTHEILYLV